MPAAQRVSCLPNADPIGVKAMTGEGARVRTT